MKIEFFNKDTGDIIIDTNDYYFVMNDKVWMDNGKSYESQSAVVCFDNFIKEMPNIGWRVIK